MGRPSLKISVCGEADRPAALKLVLRPLHASQRGPLVESLAKLRDEPLGAFEALLVGKRSGKLAAAAWAQPQPGRTASLWLPESHGRLADGEAKGLIRRAASIADGCGVSMTQVLLESDENLLVPALSATGYKRVAKLEYLEWLTTNAISSAVAETPTALTFVPHAADDAERLKRLVAETYVDTLDCPQLDGLRDLSDTLGGYRQVGRYDPAIWMFVQHKGVDAGVLLLGEHPDTRQLELVYMGVAPSARGHRIGAAAVQKAQQVAVERGAERLVLAVDAENSPATRLYQAAGFTPWASRVVYVRQRGSTIEQ